MSLSNDVFTFFKEKYVHFIVMILLFTLADTVLNYKAGGISSADTNVILQALTGIASMAILYFAYFYISAKRQEDAARLEIAVRPTLLWDIESGDGGGTVLVLRSLQHPIYNLHVELRLGNKTFELSERHIDIYDARANLEKKIDITNIVKQGIEKDKGKAKTLEAAFTYYSEVGGKYMVVFRREIERKSYGVVFKDAQIVSALYPWRASPIYFDS
jgi:hypothetical protein